MYDSILANIAKHICLNDNEKDYFVSLLKYKEVFKKNILLKEGQKCNVINFVHAGALRAYCMNNEGKDSTIMFAVNDWWVTDMYCFLNRNPAMMYIEAIKDSSIFQLTIDDLEKLFINIPKFEHFFRILMQNAYAREQLRIIDNLFLPIEQRYDKFLNKYPQIIPHITQKQIASYLGITPEFLSSIRKQKIKKPYFK